MTQVTDYFSSAQSKSAIHGIRPFDDEGSRPDLLLAQYKLARERLLTVKKEERIEQMYHKWCDLMFVGGQNVVVIGPQSKFAVLETFKKRFLDRGTLPDWLALMAAADKKQQAISNPIKTKTNVISRSSKSIRGKTTTKLAKATTTSNRPHGVPTLNVTTVRLHGLDPIKLEAFNHAILDIGENRRVKESDFQEFHQMVKRENMHYVFLIHSVEFLMIESEEVFDAILKLYSNNKRHVHLLMSSDHWNAGKKLANLKCRLQTVYYHSEWCESFLWEKTWLLRNFDSSACNATTIHRLFSDKTDLQSLKDIYQALDSASQQILTYIIKDTLEHSSTRHKVDFHLLLRHCESNFIIRRGTALRDHLGELKDHKIISEDGNKIQCLVDANISERFLKWIETAQPTENQGPF